jgi:hypothetical protein
VNVLFEAAHSGTTFSADFDFEDVSETLLFEYEKLFDFCGSNNYSHFSWLEVLDRILSVPFACNSLVILVF